MHREQLAHSLRAIYGHDFEAEGYLGRFFDLSYMLTEPQSDDYAKYLTERVGYAGAQAVTQPLIFLMIHLRLTLRQQERCLTRAALVLRIIGRGNRTDDPTLYAALLAIREWNPGIYSKFRRGEKSADDLIDAMEAVDPDRWSTQEDAERIEVALFVMDSDRRTEMRRGEDASILEWIKRLQGDESRFFRRGQWRRTLAILELGGQFQILDVQPP